MTAVYRTYLDLSDLLPPLFYSIVLAFFGLGAVFATLGIFCLVCGCLVLALSAEVDVGTHAISRRAASLVLDRADARDVVLFVGVEVDVGGVLHVCSRNCRRRPCRPAS